MEKKCCKCGITLCFNESSIRSDNKPVEVNGLLYCNSCHQWMDFLIDLPKRDVEISKPEIKKSVITIQEWCCQKCKKKCKYKKCECGEIHFLYKRRNKKKKKNKKKN